MSAVGAVRSSSLPAVPASGDTYTVQHGDTLSGIAQRLGVSLKALEAANPQIRNPSLIYPGDCLHVPGGGSSPTSGASGASAPGKGSSASGMTISEDGVKMIEGFEGYSAKAYPDPGTGGAPWTIGYGHTGGVQPGQTITQQQAETYLKQDLQTAENAVRQNVHVPLTQNQFDALVSLTYNLGPNGYPGLLATLNRGDYAGAQKQFGDYVHAGGKVLQGLVNRRAKEAALFGDQAPSGSSGSGKTAPPSSGKAPANGTYTVQAGDTLSGIAQRQGVSLKALEAANPQIGNFNQIHPGEQIHLPGSGTSKSAPASSYTVRSGDTLSGIASSHGVSLAALRAANPQIANPNLIFPGQSIRIPGTTSNQAPAAASKPASTPASSYTVRPGDTLSGIASRHGVSLAALESANPQISNPNRISVGQVIHLPGTGGSGHAAPVQQGSGTAKGTNAADKAKQYLGRYETDLEKAGVTQSGVDTSESCANFVSAMLKQSGQINWHTNLVSDLNNRLRAQGWHTVSLADAKPGDVWICNGAHGESHTEIVASNDHGKVTLIGSNNHPNPGNQQVNYDTYSASISGSFILAPP
ncbi:LysM peptidoglycan-binding domain-containing protein [Dyella sp.]|uniref:LysM peptidoglycan-binding domain-containing protein n=1 Tax=Dyella sp. TaxID=1869338 RepID=UPI002ED50364